jgi:hypothetical protein
MQAEIEDELDAQVPRAPRISKDTPRGKACMIAMA